MHPWCSPENIGSAHVTNQLPDLFRSPGSSQLSPISQNISTFRSSACGLSDMRAPACSSQATNRDIYRGVSPKDPSLLVAGPFLPRFRSLITSMQNEVSRNTKFAYPSAGDFAGDLARALLILTRLLSVLSDKHT